jgi:hypothetical protein
MTVGGKTWWSGRSAGGLGAALVALVVMAPHVFPLTSLSLLSYDALDAHLFLWNFWWTHETVSALQNPYWTPLLAYPGGASLSFHSYPMLHSLLTVPVQSAAQGIAPLFASFYVLVLVSSIASALAMYWLALRLTRHRGAAIVASLIFTGAAFRLLNVARLHIVATEFLVGYIACFVAFIDRPTRGRAAACGICLALSLYTSPEYALYSVAFSAVWMLAQWWAVGDLPRPVFWRRLLLAACIFAAIGAPLLLVQAADVRAGRVTPSRSLAEATVWSPALLSFVTPSRVHPFYGGEFAARGDYGTRDTLGMRSETAIAPTVWLLALLGCWRTRRDGSRFWVAAAAVFLVLALGPILRVSGTWATGIPMPYSLLYTLFPPLRASRDPTRFFALALIMVSVVAAYGMRACLRPIRRPGLRTAAGVAIGLLVYLDTLTIWPPKLHAADMVPAGYARLAAAPGAFAVLDLSGDQQALIAQVVHRHPITGGSQANPRGGTASDLGVEHDFRNAAAVLALDDATLAGRLAADRHDLERQNIRFVVFPEGWDARLDLARRLGLVVTVGGGLVIGELPAGSPPPLNRTGR